MSNIRNEEVMKFFKKIPRIHHMITIIVIRIALDKFSKKRGMRTNIKINDIERYQYFLNV
jgi:hypothetical protein